jgi:integrase
MREKWRSTQFRKIRLFFERKRIKYVNDVTMPDADEYANWITSIYDKPNTRRGFISAFKEFFHVLESRKIIPFNVAKHLETPKEKLHQSKTIEYEELTRMINYARERYEELPSWGNAIDYMFTLVLRDTSCRIAEIRRMKWREIDDNEQIIHIPIGKHQGEYYKFYGYIDDQLPKLLEQLKKWRKSEYVLSLENGKQYSIEGLRKIFHRIADELGIDSNPNAVRSCMADWYDRNTNLSDEEIARQIGNEPQTLRRHYKKRKLEIVKATVRKLNGNNSNSS